jgi:LemA protein
MTWWSWLAIALAVIVVIVAVRWPIATHNTLVSMQTTVVESWRGVDIELTRRWELIPSLVEVARSYARHETDLLLRIAAERGRTRLDGDPSAALGELHDHVIGDETQSSADLTNALSGLRAVAEAYPQLQSSRQYAELMLDLRDTEDRIAGARRLYNGNAARYNAQLRSFPSSVLARRARMVPADPFELAAPEHAGVPPLGDLER